MSTADKAAHSAESLKGKAKEVIGRATGNESLEAEGHADQMAAHAKQAGEHIKDAAHDIGNAARH